MVKLKAEYIINENGEYISPITSASTVLLSDGRTLDSESENKKNIADAYVLPNMFIDGGNLTTWGDKSDERKAKFTIRDLRGKDFECYVKLKPQGTTSITFPKKNFTLNFYEDSAYSIKKSLELIPEWGSQSKYVIKANWIDPTHSCNIVSARIASKMQEMFNIFPNTPNRGLVNGYPVLMHLNGISQGLYTLNIPKDGWTFGMDKNNPDHILMACESQDKSGAFLSVVPEEDGKEWTIEHGAISSATWTKFKRMHNFVKDSTNAEFKANISQYLNLDACLNYYIFAYYTTALDNLGKNMLMATYDGSVWYPCLYDLDSLYGAWWTGGSVVSHYFKCPEQYQCNTSRLWEKIVANFSQELADRFNLLSKDILTPSTVISETAKFIYGIDKRYYDEDVEIWTDLASLIRKPNLKQIREYVPTRDAYASFMIRNFSKVPDNISNRKLYTLPSIFIGNAASQNYINTGIKLLEDPNMSFTIVAKVDRPIVAPTDLGYKEVYFSCYSEATPNRGVMARVATASPTGQIEIVTGSNVSKNVNRIAPWVTTIVIRKTGTIGWDVIVDGVYIDNMLLMDKLTSYGGNLQIGCQLNSSGVPYRFSNVTVHNLEIYNIAITDANVEAIINSFG